MNGFPIAPIMAMVFLFGPLAPGAFAQGSSWTIKDMAGKIETGLSGGKFTSIEEKVGLAINPDLLVKGDRLFVYTKEKNVGSGDDVSMRRIGSLIVLSGSSQAPVGKIKNAGQEVYGEAYVGFALSAEDQTSRFLPFLQSMADAYLHNPQQRRLRVAVIDVVNPFGDRIVAGEPLLNEIRQSVCRRPQFDCVKREKIAEIMWRGQVNTSRGLDRTLLDELKNRLKIDVIVTGHIRKQNGDADVIVQARALDENVKPERVWRRFRFALRDIGATEPGFARVTARHKKAPRAEITIRIKEVATVEGMRAEYFFYKKIAEFDESFKDHDGHVGAQDYFASIDGRSYPLRMGGLFYSGPIIAGAHGVTFGYYPARALPDGQMAPTRKPFRQTIEIIAHPGERIEITIVGKIEMGYLALIADID